MHAVISHLAAWPAGRAGLCVAASLLGACLGTPAPSGSNLSINVAPLTLPGVGDACYALVVKNAANAVVWSQPSICADTYGDGQGSITYIGTCDAQSPAHTVALTLLSLEDVDGAPITDFVNPTASGPIILPANCVENADTLVVFNLTIMRSADQGFFDIAVNFEDVFCSAKLDCNAADLLHAPGGDARLDTAVVGIACTGGPAADTYLYNSGLTLTCGGTAIDIPLTGPEGNIYSTTLPAPAPFAQVATYLGVEALTNPDNTPLKKAWFNIAFGLSPGALGNCSLSFTATASDGPLTACSTGDFTAYPIINFNAPTFVQDGAFACGANGLDTATPGIGVWTSYATTPPLPVFEVEAHATPTGLTVAPCTSVVASASIGPTGGTLTYNDGSDDILTLTFPVGALSASTVISISRGADAVAPRQSPVFVLEPAGLAFNVPITATFHGLGDATSAVFWTWSADPSSFQQLATVQAGADHSAEIYHFSTIYLANASVPSPGWYCCLPINPGTTTDADCIQWSAGVGTTCDTSICTLTAGVCPAVIPATVIAHLFDDTNGDGDQDVGELNVAGARFELTLSAGAPGSGQFANTNGSGIAVFTNVAPNSYRLASTAGGSWSMPSGGAFTVPAGASQYSPVLVTSGATVVHEFGFAVAVTTGTLAGDFNVSSGTQLACDGAGGTADGFGTLTCNNPAGVGITLGSNAGLFTDFAGGQGFTLPQVLRVEIQADSGGTPSGPVVASDDVATSTGSSYSVTLNAGTWCVTWVNPAPGLSSLPDTDPLAYPNTTNTWVGQSWWPADPAGPASGGFISTSPSIYNWNGAPVTKCGLTVNGGSTTTQDFTVGFYGS